MLRVVTVVAAHARSRKLRVVATMAAATSVQRKLAARARFAKAVLARNAMAAQRQQLHQLAPPRHANPHAVARNRKPQVSRLQASALSQLRFRV